ACDLTDARHAEDLAHLGVAGNDLTLRRVEQSEHRGAYLLLDLVDDRVKANIHVFGFGYLSSSRLWPHIKANDNRCAIHIISGGSGQHNIGFGDCSYAGSDDSNLDSLS